jgi:hypothetical protein
MLRMNRLPRDTTTTVKLAGRTNSEIGTTRLVDAVLEKTGSKSARHLGRWVSWKYIQGAASIRVHQLAALEPEATV